MQNRLIEFLDEKELSADRPPILVQELGKLGLSDNDIEAILSVFHRLSPDLLMTYLRLGHNLA